MVRREHVPTLTLLDTAFNAFLTAWPIPAIKTQTERLLELRARG